MLRSYLIKGADGVVSPESSSTATFSIMTTPSAPLRRLRGFLFTGAATPPVSGGEHACPANSFTPGRNGNLETAIAVLVQNQAQLVADMAQIKRDFEEIKRYLIRHEQLLANLPEAIREKIGFKQ
jgi:hypothetical protein